MKHLPLLILLLFVSACGSKGNPAAPPGQTTPPPVTQTRIIALFGTMDFGAIQINQSFSATLEIRNQGNAPLTVTGMTAPGAGSIFTANWTSGTIPAGGAQPVSITFRPALPQSYGGTLTVNGDHTSGTNTIGISGRGSLDGIPLYSRSGFGNTVFSDMPSYITRLRIRGVWNGRSGSNFAVYVGGRLEVNEILRDAIGRAYDGVHAVTPGEVRIEISTNVDWTITEVR